MKILVNISNHASEDFLKIQKRYNEKHFEKVIDFRFPTVLRTDGQESVVAKCQRLIDKIWKELDTPPLNFGIQPEYIFMICGEFGVTHYLVSYFKEKGYTVVYPSSERIIEKKENGAIIHKYQFYKYREYLSW